MVIVQQRSLNESKSDATVGTLSYDDIYSEWSKWSKCRRRCKQVRTRQCVSTDYCGSTILKEERGCRGGKCLLNEDMSTSTPVQDVPQRGRGRASQFRVLYHLQSYVYSQWSEWSSCTTACRTRRSRSCEMKQICGNSIIQEDALCYMAGSPCEKLYKNKRKNVANSATPNVETPAANTTTEEAKDDSVDDLNCGVSSIMTDMASNLRIIGGRESTKGRWPWMVSILNRYHEPFCGGTIISPQFIITAGNLLHSLLANL
jgi:hypothetical protein